MEKTVDEIIQEASENLEVSEQKTDFLEGVPKLNFGSVEEIVNTLGAEEKQDYSANFKTEIEEETEDFEETDYQETAGDFTEDFFDEKSTNSNPNADENAIKITRWFDNVFAFVLGLFSGDTENFTMFKAEKSSLKIIEESLSEAFNGFANDFVIPWWSSLTMEVPIAYFPKIKLAMRLRKKKKKDEATQKKAQDNVKNQSNNDNITRASFQDTGNDKDIISDVEFEDIPDKKTCKLCDKPLTGKQKVFCSNSCKTTHLKQINRKG